MREIRIEELRELQMQILDYVDAFCCKHEIKYTLSGGTLLGAVRHGGYIPWDDDIDIQMLRNEYIRFTELWNASKSGHPYEFISIESGNSYGSPIGKVCNPNTILIVREVEITGVFVDVFPVDYVKDMDDFSIRHSMVMKLRKLQGFDMALKQKKYHNWIERLMIKFRKSNKSLCQLAEEINGIAMARHHQSQNCSYLFELVAGSLCKSPIPKSIFNEYQRIPFENRMYMAVKDYDTYLAATFGDYMTLPPVEKRITHHHFDAYWKD